MPELIHIQKVTFGSRDLRATLSFAQNGPVMTNANPQAAERVKWLVPEIMRHACTGDAGKNFGVSLGRTEIAHLVEHVALELMALTNLSTPITSGRTRRIADHLYEVQIAAPDDVLAASCKEKIGRAKYIPEENVGEFDEIFRLMNTELKAIAQGGSEDV